MFKMAIILAALVGGDNGGGIRMGFPHDPTYRAGFIQWRVVRVLDKDRILVETNVRLLPWFKMDGTRDGSYLAIPFNGYSSQLILLSGIPADMMKQQNWDWTLPQIQFAPAGQSDVAKGNGQSFVLEFSHSKFLADKAKWDVVQAEMLAKKKDDEQRAKQNAEKDAAEAKRERACDVEFKAIEKNIKALKVSLTNLEKSADDFNRNQARLGLERNIAKLQGSIKKLAELGCPPATLAEKSAMVQKAIDSAKNTTGAPAKK